MKKQFQSNLDGVRMGGGSIEHPFSIHSASIGTRWKPRVLQVLMTMVFLFTLGIGQMWAEDPTLPTECLDLPTTSTYMSGLEFNGSSYTNKYYLSTATDTLILNHYLMNQSSITNSKKIKWITYNGKGSSGADWNAGFGFKGKNYWGVNSQANVRSDRVSWYRIKGASKFVALYNQSGSSKKCIVSAYEITYVGETPSKASSASVARSKESSSADTIQLTLDSSKEYIIEIKGSSTSGYRMPEVMFIAPTCTPSTTTFANGNYTVGGSALNLTSLITADATSTGAITFAVKNANGTGATITGSSFTATASGSATVTATQAADATHGICEKSIDATITVIATNPVTEVTVAGAASGYKNNKVIFTATAANATQYEWYVDGTKQGSDSAKLHFTPTEVKTYSIVCKAKNAFNSDWVASSAHSLTVTSLYGDLIHFTAKTSGSSINEDLPAANIGGIVGGTVHQKSQSNAKLNSGGYYSLTLASGSFQAGDTVRIVVKPEGDNHSVPATLMLSSLQNNSNPIGSVSGLSAPTTANITADIILTAGAQTIFLSRDGTVSSQNPIVVSMAVIRPMPVKSTAYDLTAVKINGTAISAAELATLKTADEYLVDLMAGYAAAPVVKFARQTTTTYEDDSQKVANDTITVTASEVSSKWQAQATIGTITYTVKAAKQSSAKVYYYDGETKIGEEAVAIGGHPAEYEAKQSKNLATFVGWYNNADLAEEHKIADISELVVAKDTTVYGKWTYTYAQSVNVEKWVLDNGKTPNSDKTGALRSLLGARGFASNLAYEEGKLELDSLNDSKGTGRNYTYLGLKVKLAGKMLDFRLAKDNTVKVKFGNVGSTPLLAINGGEYANMTIEDGVFAYTATGEDYISIKTASTAAVVFQQIMIGEDIQDVTLPEPTRHAVVLTKAGETEHGTLAVASPETYNWLAKDAAVTLTVAADAGYYIESVTLNGDALTPSENVYSFAMPNATANVVATFAEIIPNNVTYMPNGATGPEYIVDYNATEVLGCPSEFTAPASTVFAGWNTDPDGNGDAYAEGDLVLSPLQLYAQWRSYFTITYMDGEDQLDTENVFEGEAPVGIADPVKAMNIFQGWTLAGSDEVINVTTLDATTTVYAKWEAIDACFYFGAKSVTEDEAITAPANLDNAFGGTLEATDGTFKYTTTGVLIEGGGSKYFTVNLNYALQEGSKITVKMYAGGTSERGLNLRVAGSSSNVYQYKWTPSATEPAQMEYEYEYVVPANSPLIGKKVFYLYRNNNVYLQTVMVKDCAPQDYTVTYKDGETTLGTEQVFENAHPTADGINTHKKGYDFQGWAETVDGAVVDLDDITITAAKNLFAQYTVKDCSPKGVKFSMEAAANEWSSDYQPDGNTIVSLADYATISGGEAYVGNGSSSKHVKVLKTSSAVQLTGSAGFIRILLDCPLAANDTIKLDNTNKCIVSIDSLKAKKANLASGSHAYVAPAEWADADTIYVWRDGNNVDFTSIQVIRPEIYSVSFNMMGHGSAIAPVDVVKGGKITAPTAPTDENYAFGGWYKENTLSNAWDFANDVVTAATTLYAKWLDMSDATLKSLKYGAEEIALQAGVYTYDVELPALTTAVPALTAATSNPNASAVVADAAAFDESGNAQSTVTVTPQKEGAATQTYTVNFAKTALVALQDVTGTTTWDFTGAVTADVTIQNTLTVIANYAGVTVNAADKMEVKGTKFMKSPACVRANQMHFYTTVPGKLTVEYSNTGGNAVRYLYVNGVKYDEEGSTSTSKKGGNVKVFVPAGDVTLVMMDGSDASKELNIYTITFDATPDYTRNVTSNIGTLCVDHNVLVGGALGATFYQIASRNVVYDFKIDFEEVLPNEELKAGEPYIFQSTTGRIDLFYGETEADAPVAVRGMHGWFDATAPIDPTKYDMLDITGDNMSDILYISQNKLWSCENLLQDDLKVVNNRAYIVMSEVPTYEDYVASQQNNGAPRRRVTMGRNGEQSATGFENLNASEKPMKLLINGQIFILRGEKMFDATGRLVK